MPWLLSTRRLRSAGGQPADEPVRPRHGFARRMERRGGWRPSCACACSRARARRRSLRRLTERIGRQPRPPAPFVFGPWYQPRDDEASDPRAPAARRRSPLGGADLHPLPALRGPARARGRGARTRAPLPRRRTGRDHLLQPDDLHGRTRRYGEAAAGGGWCATPRASPTSTATRTRESFDVAQFDFTRAPGGGSTGACWARRWATDTTAGWRTSASTRRSTRAPRTGPTGSALHNLYPRQYHCAAQRGARRARCASSARAGPGRRAARRWCGAATRRWAGASTACAPPLPTG